MNNTSPHYIAAVWLHKEALKFARKCKGNAFTKDCVFYVDVYAYSPVTIAALGCANLIFDFSRCRVGIYDDGGRSIAQLRRIMKAYCDAMK